MYPDNFEWLIKESLYNTDVLASFMQDFPVTNPFKHSVAP